MVIGYMMIQFEDAENVITLHYLSVSELRTFRIKGYTAKK